MPLKGADIEATYRGIMRFKSLGLAAAVAAVVFGLGSANAAGRHSIGPDLPFERYFASKTGEASVLKFNDFSGKIDASRIKKLLRSGNLLGDRVLLKNNAAVYFPDGYIVSFSIRLERWLAKNGMGPEQVRSSHEVEPNPDYVLVSKVEEQLGRVCAEIPDSNPQEKIRLRKSRSGILSLVKRTVGRFDHIVGEPSETIVITSAMEPQFLSPDNRVWRAASSCI